jgi:hypothetical protein
MEIENRKKPTRRMMPPRRWAFILLSDVHKLARYRIGFGEILPAKSWTEIIAAILAVGTRGPTLIRGKKPVTTFPGLDFETLRKELRKIGIKASDAVIAEAVEKASRRGKPISGKEIGTRLKVHADERAEARSFNLIPYGETRETLKADRKLRNVERQRKARKAKGADERAVWLANQRQEASKPWEAEGISRRTWFTRKAKVTAAKTVKTKTEPPNTAQLAQVRVQPITVGNHGMVSHQCKPSTVERSSTIVGRPRNEPRGKIEANDSYRHERVSVCARPRAAMSASRGRRGLSTDESQLERIGL